MKQKIIKKYKWYLFGAISVMLILSIGLSFCTWDSNSSINKLGAKSADFGKHYYLSTDNDSDSVADVGDTILFGSYYQSDNDTTKTALEWRVVDIREENGEDVMYLLTEKAVATGNFNYYGHHFKIDGTKVNPTEKIFDVCYVNSAIRAWLNSDKFGLPRSDGGNGFSNMPSGNDKVFNGFYDEAFTDSEKTNIIARTIPSMYGHSKIANENAEKIFYDELENQKVWIPSVMELTGNNIDNADSEQDIQFTYFTTDNAKKLLAESTNFNKINNNTMISNFSHKNVPLNPANLGQPQLNSNNIYYWTRTPGYDISLNWPTVHWITPTGTTTPVANYNDTGAVRPAICLKR